MSQKYIKSSLYQLVYNPFIIKIQKMKSSKNPKKFDSSAKPTPAHSRISNHNETNLMGRKNVASSNQGYQKNKHYLHLPNQEYLVRNLKLLGVSEQQFMKETKTSLLDSTKIFPKSLVNPTASKQFFYISFFCLQNICCKNQEQLASLAMWYPPRTVNEQLQFKKALFKIIQNLQIIGKLPKNLLVSKGTIMGDSSSATLIQFLRILSELALRAQYLEKYSKRQRLVQISCQSHENNKPQNDINRFYVYPFAPNGLQPPSHINLQVMKNMYKYYIKIYLKKLSCLRTMTIQQDDKFHMENQSAMKNLMQQKQVHQTLTTKIPKKLLSQNRSFDRRRMIDRNQQIWEELQKIQCNYMEKSQIPVLKVEGEIDSLLKRWEPVKGIANILEANNLMSEQYAKLKSRCERQLNQFQKTKQKITKILGIEN